MATRTFGAGDKLTFAAGPQQLGLLSDLPAGKSLKEYQIELYSTEALSVAYRYTLNYAYQPYARYLSYLNSLGAPDTITTFGKGSAELQLFSEQAERYLDVDYDPKGGQYIPYNVQLQQQQQVTTGFRGQKELQRWDDFYRSPIKFLHTGGQAIFIGIVSGTIKQAKDGDTQFAHSFEFSHLYRQEFYTGDDSDETDDLPPVYFVPAGQVIVNIESGSGTGGTGIDPTISDELRDVTPAMISQWNLAYAWGNHGNAGYLTRQVADNLYALKADIADADEIANIYLRKDELNWDLTAEGGDVDLLSELPDLKEIAVWELINDVRVIRRLPVSKLPPGFLSGDDDPDGETGETGNLYLQKTTKILYGPKTDDGWGDGVPLKGDKGGSILTGTADPTADDGDEGDQWFNKTTKTLFGPKTESGWGTGTSLKGDKGMPMLSGTVDPDSSVGQEGDWYFQKTSKIIYGPKTSGAWGTGVDLGSPGSSSGGSGGGTGTRWYNGLGLPGSTLGSNGDYYINFNTGDVYEKASGVWIIAGNIQGPQGPAGSGGSGGGTGSGSVWYDGGAAPSAGTGTDGDYYLRTLNGDVYKKASGLWSVVGNIKGAAGTAGSRWYSNPGAPSAGTGADTDFYLNTTNGDVYQKSAGAWLLVTNLKGAQGNTGTAGAAGSRFYNGSGAPSAGTGTNIDLYLNTATGDVYEKTSGSWAVSGNIKGAQGNAGTAGAAGSKWFSNPGVPSAGTGADNDFYLNTANGDVYQKTSGAWLLVTNLKGAAGTAGSRFYSAAGAPSAGNGANGDLYLNTTTGDVYEKASGNWSVTGNIKGAAGTAGAAGSKWFSNPGAPSAGTGVDTDFYLNTTNGDVYQKTSGAWLLVTNLKGAAGTAGSKWYNAAGAPSAGTGVTGDYYLNSTNGDVYEKQSGGWTAIGNIRGPQGTAGSGGSGGTGSVWYDGAAVPSSTTGIDGDYYLRSTTGDVYRKTAGTWWLTGNIKGAAGTAGSRWYSNPGAPSAGTGVDTDFYLNTTNGDIYQKTSGAWLLVTNIKGAQGNTGTAGAAGSRFYSGSGAPSAGTGTNIDLYLNTATGDVYEKTSGSWAVSGNIKGAQGNTGTAGAAGSRFYSGSGVPSAGTGTNIDLYLNTANGDVYEKTSGSWAVSGNIRGVQGNTGNTGTAGSRWYSNPGAPSAGTGVDTDFYLNTTNGDVYQKSAGAWLQVTNIKGVQGNTGTAGAAGSRFYSGSGAPSAGTGTNIDLYLNTATGDVYEKTSGSWAVSGNIKGAQGNTGTAGAAGSRFYAGAGAPSPATGTNIDLYLNVLTGDVYEKTSGSWAVSGNIKGPQGIQGNTGTAGAAGSRFYSGSGAPSAGTGTNIDLYLNTATGDVYEKTAGSWAVSGNIKGAQGTQGNTGTAGNNAYTGTTANYTQPAVGSSVAVSVGNSGWATVGQIVYQTFGGYYEVVSTGSGTLTLKNLGYTGSGAGATVIPGALVPAGMRGTDGKTIISATVAPADGVGNNGDYWYNINTNTFYGPKSGGIWPAGFSLTGPQGPKGDTGQQGIQGIQGPQGPTGPDWVIRFGIGNGPRFIRLATLPANSSGTYDETIVTGCLGGFLNNEKCLITARFSTRLSGAGELGYNYNYSGNNGSAGIRVYKNADGSFSVYAYASAQFVSGALMVFSSQGTPEAGAGSQFASVSGTLMFDSQAPSTYQPDWRFDVGGFTVKGGLAAPRLFGTAMPAINSTVLSTSAFTMVGRENSTTELVMVTLPQLKQALSVATTSISAQSGSTGQNFSYNAGQHFTDPAGQPLSFSVSGGPPGVGIAASTGVLNGTPAAAGVYTVTVTSTDVLGWTKSVSFQLTVLQVGSTVDNLYYEWDTNSKGYWGYAKVSDTDNAVAYEILLTPLSGQSGGPAQTYRAMSAGSWTYNGITYNRRYQFAPAFAGGADVNAGWWRQRVRKVSDSNVARQADVQLIAGSNSAGDITANSPYVPPANNPPVWQAGGPYRVARKRQSVTQLPVANDPEGGAVSYSCGSLPAGLSFNSSTRQISGLTEVALGDYSVVVTATDSAGQAAVITITLTVAMSVCTDFRVYNAGDQLGAFQFIYERHATYSNNYGNPRGFASTSELIASMQTENSGYYNYDFARVTGGNWVANSRVWASNNPNLTSGFSDYPYDEAAWIARNPSWVSGQLQSVEMIRLNDCGYIQEIQTYTAGTTQPPAGFSYTVPSLLSAWPESETRYNYHGKPLGPGKMSLDNGIIRIEMWQGYGATIGFFGASGGVNVINQTDHGRGADDGIYTGPEPDYSQNGKNPNPNWPGLGYNPLGIGDSYNNSSQVLAYSKYTV